MLPSLYILSGPTAVGKTESALSWAMKNNAEILSCDSLLFYKGMDIGTAKPTREEQLLVPHHAVDIVPVNEQYNVGRYAEFAKQSIRDIHSRGKQVLIVGGSGFYLKAFFAAVTDNVEVGDAIRKEVALISQNEGLAGLLRKLREFNTEADLELLDSRNPRRVEAALARCWQSGKSIGRLRYDFSMLPSPFAEFPKTFTLLSRSRETLRVRVKQRVKQMFDSGLLEEVRRLLTQGIESNFSAANAIGYRETIAYLKDGGNMDELEEQIAVNTMQLIRKQDIWFRHQVRPDTVIDLDTTVNPVLF